MNNSSANRAKAAVPNPTAASVYSKALRYGAAVTLGVAVVGSVVGYLVAGLPGIYSAFMGAGLALVFLGLTAASMIFAVKVTGDAPPPDPRFFGIIFGTWFVKLLVFIGVAIWLRSQSWLDPTVFAVASIAAVVALLIVDVVALQSSRVPYVDVTLPGDVPDPTEKSAPNS